MSDWWLSRGSGAPEGPFPSQTLVIELSAGRIPSQAYVCRVGDQRWVRVSQIGELWNVAFPAQSEQKSDEQPWLQKAALAQTQLLREATGEGDDEEEDERTQILTPLPIVAATDRSRPALTPLPRIPAAPGTAAAKSQPLIELPARDKVPTLDGIQAEFRVQPQGKAGRPGAPAYTAPSLKPVPGPRLSQNTVSPLPDLVPGLFHKSSPPAKEASQAVPPATNGHFGAAPQGLPGLGLSALPRVPSLGALTLPPIPTVAKTQSVPGDQSAAHRTLPPILGTGNSATALPLRTANLPSASANRPQPPALAVPLPLEDETDERTRILGSLGSLDPQPIRAPMSASSTSPKAPLEGSSARATPSLAADCETDEVTTIAPDLQHMARAEASPKARRQAEPISPPFPLPQAKTPGMAPPVLVSPPHGLKAAEESLPFTPPEPEDADPSDLLEEDTDDNSVPIRQAQPRPLAQAAPHHTARPVAAAPTQVAVRPIISQPPKPIPQAATPSSIVLRPEPIVHLEATRPALRALQTPGVVQLTYGTLVIGALAIALFVLVAVLLLK